MAIIKCPECGHQVSEHAKACPSCGVEIEGKIKKCPLCGSIISVFHAACPFCRNASEIKSTEEVASKSVAEVAAENIVKKPVVPRREPRRPVETPKPNENKDKRSVKVMVISFVIAVVLVGSGLALYFSSQSESEHHAYHNAMESTAAVVLQNYLDLYKDAPRTHRDSVMIRLKKLNETEAEWDSVLVRNGRDDYEAYMSTYPTSVHVVEAGIKIDSIDWQEAEADSTYDAYTAYIKAHPEGNYVDVARVKAEGLDPTNVSVEELHATKAALARFFKALAANDGHAITAVTDSILTTFMKKENARNSDVVAYMHKLHATYAPAKLFFSIDADFTIEKQDAGDGKFSWHTTFHVDQKVEAPNPTKSVLITYKADVILSPEMKVKAMTMEKI